MALTSNSPGLWPIGVLDPSLFLLANFSFQLSFLSTFILAFFPSCPFSLFPHAFCQHALSRAWPPWGPGGHEPPPLANSRGQVSRFLASLGPIFSTFWAPKSGSKKHLIFQPSKNDQNGRINRPLDGQGVIFHQKTSAAPRRVQGVLD